MARPGLIRHRKFLRLARALKSEALALGHLEFLWQAAYESGDDYLGDAADVEAAAAWRGKPGVLCDALLSAGGDGLPGFIEETEGHPGRFRVHDLYDHAPEYVRKRLDRENARKREGKTLSDVRAEAARNRWAKAKQMDASDCRLQSKCNANGTPPAPTPVAVQPAPVAVQPAPVAGDTPEAASQPLLPGLVDDASTPKAAVSDLQAAWNSETSPPLPRWQETGKTRSAHARARISERPIEGPGGWREVIKRIAASSFCRGENDRGWVAGPDFLLRPDTATKALEGTYDDRAFAGPKNKPGGFHRITEADKKALAEEVGDVKL